MWIVAYVLGVVALILLSAEGSPVSSSIGWTIVTLIVIDYSARSGLRKDVEVNGAYNNTPVTKFWIFTGTVAEIMIVALSIYVYIKILFS